MAHPNGPTFNQAAVRDALGLVRMLFSIEKSTSFGDDEDALDAHLTRMNLLTEIGKQLATALNLRNCSRDSLGYRAAIGHSEEAVNKLVAITWPHDVAAVVRVAQSRVVSCRPAPPTESTLKKMARAARG